MRHISRSDEVLARVHEGVTAIICDSVLAAHDIRTQLEAAGVHIPQDVSLSLIDCCTDGHPCSGQYVDSAATAKTVADLMSGPANAVQRRSGWHSLGRLRYDADPPRTRPTTPRTKWRKRFFNWR